MADTKISALPSAGPLTGDELVPIVQNNGSGDVTVKTTVAEIAQAGQIQNVNTTISVTLTAADSGKCISNKGAGVQITALLPEADPDHPVQFEFVNMAAAGIKLQLQGNDVFLMIGDSSSAGGFIQSLTKGSIRVRSMNGTDWQVMSVTGDWQLG